jgi:hypothetical protein
LSVSLHSLVEISQQRCESSARWAPVGGKVQTWKNMGLYVPALSKTLSLLWQKLRNVLQNVYLHHAFGKHHPTNHKKWLSNTVHSCKWRKKNIYWININTYTCIAVWSG